MSLQEYTVKGQVYANVIGRLDLGRKKTIILGAHYDVCHDQQGADDNASAVAGLLELAHILGALNIKQTDISIFSVFTA